MISIHTPPSRILFITCRCVYMYCVPAIVTVWWIADIAITYACDYASVHMHMQGIRYLCECVCVCVCVYLHSLDFSTTAKN